MFRSCSIDVSLRSPHQFTILTGGYSYAFPTGHVRAVPQVNAAPFLYSTQFPLSPPTPAKAARGRDADAYGTHGHTGKSREPENKIMSYCCKFLHLRFLQY